MESSPYGWLAWAQRLSPGEPAVGICPTAGAGREGVLAGGRALVPESGTARPLELQLPYAGVGAHRRATADGVQGRRGSCSGVKSGAGLRAGDAILTPYKNTGDRVACGRATTRTQPATVPSNLQCPLLGAPFPSVQPRPSVESPGMEGYWWQGAVCDHSCLFLRLC